jgi:hypothetical protein
VNYGRCQQNIQTWERKIESLMSYYNYVRKDIKTFQVPEYCCEGRLCELELQSGARAVFFQAMVF